MATFELEKMSVRKKKPLLVDILTFAMKHRVLMMFSCLLLSCVILVTMNSGAYVDYSMNGSKSRRFSSGQLAVKNGIPRHDSLPPDTSTNTFDDLDDVYDDIFQEMDKIPFNDNLPSTTSEGGTGYYEDDLFVADTSQLSKEELLQRRSKIVEEKLVEVVSKPDLLRDEDTVWGQAFKFIVESDKRQLKPSDDLLIQRYVLALIYYATSGPEWKYGNLHFLTEVHECHWKKKVKNTLVGVIDCEGMHVTSLELSGQDLSGPLLAEIGLLERLNVLDLGNNYLTGTLPSQLGNLKKLTHLTLASNLLTGSIPVELGYLEKAEEVLLQFNSIRGTVPLSMCSLKNEKNLKNFWTDCAASTPPLFCNCCTFCCNGFQDCAQP